MENLHPMFVHFPIAFLMGAFLVESLALFLKRSEWHRISLWFLAFGAVSGIAAVLTGLRAEATAKHSFDIWKVMQLHKKLNFAVLGAALAVLAWRLAARDNLSQKGRWIAWGILAAACGLLAYSAHLGGRLVFEFGVGGIYGKIQ